MKIWADKGQVRMLPSEIDSPHPRIQNGVTVIEHAVHEVALLALTSSQALVRCSTEHRVKKDFEGIKQIVIFVKLGLF